MILHCAGIWAAFTSVCEANHWIGGNGLWLDDNRWVYRPEGPDKPPHHPNNGSPVVDGVPTTYVVLLDTTATISLGAGVTISGLTMQRATINGTGSITVVRDLSVNPDNNIFKLFNGGRLLGSGTLTLGAQLPEAYLARTDTSISFPAEPVTDTVTCNWNIVNRLQPANQGLRLRGEVLGAGTLQNTAGALMVVEDAQFTYFNEEGDAEVIYPDVHVYMPVDNRGALEIAVLGHGWFHRTFDHHSGASLKIKSTGTLQLEKPGLLEGSIEMASDALLFFDSDGQTGQPDIELSTPISGGGSIEVLRRTVDVNVPQSNNARLFLDNSTLNLYEDWHTTGEAAIRSYSSSTPAVLGGYTQGPTGQLQASTFDIDSTAPGRVEILASLTTANNPGGQPSYWRGNGPVWGEGELIIDAQDTLRVSSTSSWEPVIFNHGTIHRQAANNNGQSQFLGHVHNDNGLVWCERGRMLFDGGYHDETQSVLKAGGTGEIEVTTQEAYSGTVEAGGDGLIRFSFGRADFLYGSSIKATGTADVEILSSGDISGAVTAGGQGVVHLANGGFTFTQNADIIQ
ncbi:MAG: hypothetical protein JNG86_19525, partial [Verrucomicrobiaceae bacterium]|nr:hypothetical protein [Verrucomicrobiaceae bacterium]